MLSASSGDSLRPISSEEVKIEMAASYFARAQQEVEPTLPFIYPALIESPLILCVDEDLSVLELLEDVFTACGLRAICTSDCSTALKLISSEPIDLVVMNCQMPRMDGLTLAERIRRCKSEVRIVLRS